MEYRTYGRGDELISSIGFGSERLEDCSLEETIEMFECATKKGVNIIDMYIPDPYVRDNVGLALEGIRDKWYIQGHLCTIQKNGQYERTRNIEEVKTSFDDMLTRLKTDYIDFGMIHYVDSEADYNKVMDNGVYDYARELQKQGVIKHLSFSSHDPVIATKMAQLDGMDFCMFSINPAYDMEDSEDTNIWDMMEHKGFDLSHAKVNPKRLDFYKYCEENGIGISVMKAFGGGTLLDAGTSPFNKALSIYQCMKYALDKPVVTTDLLGYASLQELKDALKYFDIPDEEKDYSFLYEIKDFGVTGRCMYCGHCLPCPANINIASVNKFLDLATIHDKVPDTVMDHYMALEHHGSDCLKCGKCESNCPFGVKIRERMALAAETFGK